MSSIVSNTLTTLDLDKIIAKLDNRFSSHDFIKKFSQEYESEYIGMLDVYKGKGVFRTVHGQIARYLSRNQKSLNIETKGKDNSENIFGNKCKVEFWKK